MSIIQIIICFIVVFLAGCVIGLVLFCLAAEEADGKYCEPDELYILDDIMEGDDD